MEGRIRKPEASKYCNNNNVVNFCPLSRKSHLVVQKLSLRIDFEGGLAKETLNKSEKNLVPIQGF